jgi:Legionella pneumophila major outer membrane protein precursor
MIRHVFTVTALAVTLAIGVVVPTADAQNNTQAGQSNSTGMEAIPAPSHASSNNSYPRGFDGDGDGYAGEGWYGDDGCYAGECGDGCGCDEGYCECGGGCGYGYGGDWCSDIDCCGLFSAPGVPRRWFLTADYLYVRANFSDAVAYLNQIDDELPTVGVDEFHQLNFRHDSSYRFGGGYYLACCDEQIRFNFTRLTSYADQATAVFGNFVPYEVTPPPDGQTLINATVDVKSYDLEYAKTIPLGGSCCSSCECGDACGCDPCGGGCGDCCGSCGGGGCPAWDITWSGGLRFANVDWERSYVATDSEDTVTASAIPRMNFDGGGPRVGLEGRRYFGDRGWFSMYLKGDISLLLGNLDLTATRVTDPGTVDQTTVTQAINCRHIIPVTELEAGLAARLTSYSNVSVGYLFSAWHDLGFRDQFGFPTFMETSYDDANILGFDGFFAHWDIAF